MMNLQNIGWPFEDARSIKAEINADSLSSPPTSPSLLSSLSPPVAPSRRIPLDHSSRTRPYPATRPSNTKQVSMSTGPPYESWLHMSGHQSRRSSDGSLTYGAAFGPETTPYPNHPESSLGPMVNVHSYASSAQPPMSFPASHWPGQDSAMNGMFPGLSPDYPPSQHPSPYASQSPPPMGYPPSSTIASPLQNQHMSVGDDLLRARVHQLEQAAKQDKRRVASLEKQLAQFSQGDHPSPSSVHSTPPPSASFQASWSARTSARVKLFCSLNRAGNALCSWHDSRRERRMYPPRMAPAGYLNCGCTYEEALFEESLSRHAVGSYLPGDMVRMDPALRNPLLKLLQSRYNYHDGDFERDSRTGGWVANEGPQFWEQQVSGRITNPRRPRSGPTDNERRQ